MNSHHLKHPPPSGRGRDGQKMILHDLITNRLGLAPFQPLTDTQYVEMAKRGRFHQSSCALALYSNAFTQKAMFPEDLAPYGYLHKRFGEQFSFGVYRRHDGNLFGSILPLTSNLETIATFTREAMSELPIKGIYVRFLRIPQYARLVTDFGFKPAKEEPWLPDAPEEDESLSHSRVDLDRVFSQDGSLIFPPLKKNFNRASNFLERLGLEYRLTTLRPSHLHIALDIVKTHFDMIEEKGKLVGSTFHDYLGLLNADIISLKSVSAYLGFIGELPVSVFIGESNGERCMSGYAGITLRNIDYALGLESPAAVLPDEGPDGPGSSTVLVGSSSIPTYVFIRLFSQFHSEGYRYFFMGGSEHADIDTWKHKRMGAEKDPTYWAVFT
jgi:hypothetical protein